jgi:HEAT repeat protein
MSDSKEVVKEFLRGKQYQMVLDLLGKRRKTVRVLRSILYEEDALLRWRAVTMFGKLAASNPELVRKEVSSLLWSMSDEAGAIGRGAPETIGEIGRNNIHLAGNAVNAVIHYLDDSETCRPPNRNVEILIGVLWATGRAGEKNKSLMKDILPALETFLDDTEPEVRGHAAWSLGQIGAGEAQQKLSRMTDDQEMILLYENEELQQKSVAMIAEEALARIVIDR